MPKCLNRRHTLRRVEICSILVICAFLIWLSYLTLTKPDDVTDGHPHIHRLDLSARREGRAERQPRPQGEGAPDPGPGDAGDTDFLSVGSVHEYCNPPEHMRQGDEGEVPKNYKLEMVHVLIRHGDRTSMHKMGSRRNPPVSCKFDDDLVNNNNLIKQYLKHLTQHSKRHHPGSDFAFWDTFPDEPVCEASKLTPKGVHQHLINGRNFYNKYLQKMKLVEGNLTHKQVIVRSSEVSRTYQSAIAFMFGFLPNFNFSEFIVRKSPTNFCSKKLSGYNCDCPGKFAKLEKSERFAGLLYRHRGPQQDVKNFLAEVYDLPVSKVPFITQVMDILMGQACHGIPLKCGSDGKCIDKSMVDLIWSLVEEEGVKARVNNDHYLTYSHLAFHPLLSEIVLRMSNVTKFKSPVKFVLYSGHDITLTPFLSLLGIYDGKWPPYASRLSIEMYQRMEDGKSHHFVRVVYNGVDVTTKLQFCKTLVDGLCRFKHFVMFAKNHLRSRGIKSYDIGCK